jgi:hypothetical protein
MDCKTAHMLLDLVRPGAAELDAAEADALRDHLDACPACAALAACERQLDEYLGQAVRDVPVPDLPKSRLLAHLGRERAVLLRRRALRVAAVAAGIALAVAFWWYWQYSRRPVLDVDQIVRMVDRKAFNGPEAVEEWFREQGVHMLAPTQFGDAQLNYNLLDSYDLVEFRGVRVPHLLFLNPGSGGASARIYVLSDRSFKVDEQAPRDPAVGSTHRVQVFRSADHPDVIYLVIYTGESLKPFYTAPRPAA